VDMVVVAQAVVVVTASIELLNEFKEPGIGI
jgi:hypothetical protein